MDKHICLVTFYDPQAMGNLILSANIKAAGGKCTFLNVREQRGDEVTSYDPSGDLYITLNGGRMFREVDVITDSDLSIAASFIYNLKPDYVGLSTRSFAMEHAKNLAQKLPDFTIIAGGWGPTLEPEKAYEWADWVCFGEGDKTIMDIARGVPLHEIRNLHNKSHPLKNIYPALTSNDLEALPFPDPHSGNRFQIENNTVSQLLPPSAPTILVSRGCPMSCSYCMGGAYRKMYRAYTSNRFPKHRIRSIDAIIEEIQRYSDFSMVHFMDEIFPWKKTWVDEFCEKFKSEIGTTFKATLRVEFHPEKQIEQLIHAGLIESTIGLQSASPRILREVYTRGFTPEQTLRLAEIFTKRGIPYCYQILMNNPYETEEDIKKTLDWLWSAPQQSVTVFNLVAFPNSPLGKRIMEENPPPTDKVLHTWYGWIASIAALGKWQRRASKVVYYLRLFRHHPGILIWAYTKLFKWKHGKGNKI